MSIFKRRIDVRFGGDVRILDQTVEKGARGNARAVAEKYAALHQLGPTAGFVAPAVVSVDEERDIVVLERIHGISSIREIYWRFMIGKVEEDAAKSVFKRIGGALASIHRELVRPATAQWRADDEFIKMVRHFGFKADISEAIAPVQLHGDYGFANLFTRKCPGGGLELVVIDPCQDGYSTTEDWCHGPRYVDIGKMLLSLEGKVPLLWHPFLRANKICAVQRSFLDGYQVADQVVLDREKALAFAYGLCVNYFRARCSPWVQNAAVTLMYNSIWKRNFPLTMKVDYMDRAG